MLRPELKEDARLEEEEAGGTRWRLPPERDWESESARERVRWGAGAVQERTLPAVPGELGETIAMGGSTVTSSPREEFSVRAAEMCLEMFWSGLVTKRNETKGGWYHFVWGGYRCQGARLITKVQATLHTTRCLILGPILKQITSTISNDIALQKDLLRLGPDWLCDL